MASFVTTWMEPEVAALMQDCLNVNIVDMDEYPSTTDIHNRCGATTRQHSTSSMISAVAAALNVLDTCTEFTASLCTAGA
jgi:glutamate/tyrosine decarboxylase-like PLP-dependent enzyme